MKTCVSGISPGGFFSAGTARSAVATHLLSWAQHFSVETKAFYAFYLVSHGVVKLFLVIGLLRNKLWAYPASLVVLGLFIAYQLYRFSYTHGFGLIVLTLFDPKIGRIFPS